MNSTDTSINLIKSVANQSSIQMPPDFHIDHWQDGPLNRWAFQHVSEFLTLISMLIEKYLSLQKYFKIQVQIAFLYYTKEILYMKGILMV